jgi:hypothetical protein
MSLRLISWRFRLRGLKIKTTAAGLGSRTMAFFRRGDELEASSGKSATA